MLHMGMLPYHRGWARFLSRLQDIIVDEPHSYQGVFGGHFSLILRRLQRVVVLYRKTPPTFLFGCATIGNPDDHATQLLGKPVSAITESGAPSGGRLTLLWQPPDDRSYLDEAAGLMAFFVAQGIRTILFVNLRQVGQRLTIVASGERKIEDTDIHHAVTECHPGAIYYSQARDFVSGQTTGPSGRAH
jgi:DEAD/DEAH box helicase domain-containing protein